MFPFIGIRKDYFGDRVVIFILQNEVVVIGHILFIILSEFTSSGDVLIVVFALLEFMYCPGYVSF